MSRALGAAPEQRIAMCTLDDIDFPSVFWWLHTMLTSHDYAFMIAHSRAALVVVSDARIDKVRGVVAPGTFVL